MILGSSVAGIDSTVVAVALPAIGRNLHTGFQGLQRTVTSYTLTLAALILLAGSLSDRWGRRRVFLADLGWFTAASVLCATRTDCRRVPIGRCGNGDRDLRAGTQGRPCGLVERGLRRALSGARFIIGGTSRL